MSGEGASEHVVELVEQSLLEKAHPRFPPDPPELIRQHPAKEPALTHALSPSAILRCASRARPSALLAP
jgi:hypothetical protein